MKYFIYVEYMDGSKAMTPCHSDGQMRQSMGRILSLSYQGVSDGFSSIEVWEGGKRGEEGATCIERIERTVVARS